MRTPAQRLAETLPRDPGESARQYQVRRIEAVIREMRRGWAFGGIARRYGYKPRSLRAALRRWQDKTGERTGVMAIRAGELDDAPAAARGQGGGDPWDDEHTLGDATDAFLDELRDGSRVRAAAEAAGFRAEWPALMAAAYRQLRGAGVEIDFAAARRALPGSEIYQLAQATLLALTSRQELSRAPGPAVKMAVAAQRILGDIDIPTRPPAPILVTGPDPTDEEIARAEAMLAQRDER